MISNYLTGRFRTETDDSAVRDESDELSAALEERDQTIALLEQAIGELQAQIGELETDIEQARFQHETLERSYSTQLKDAREATEAAEVTIGEQRERIEQLERSERELKRQVEGLRLRLEPYGPDPASIDELISGTPAPHPARPPEESAVAVEPEAEIRPAGDMLAPDEMFVDQKN